MDFEVPDWNSSSFSYRTKLSDNVKKSILKSCENVKNVKVSKRKVNRKLLSRRQNKKLKEETSTNENEKTEKLEQEKPSNENEKTKKLKQEKPANKKEKTEKLKQEKLANKKEKTEKLKQEKPSNKKEKIEKLEQEKPSNKKEKTEKLEQEKPSNKKEKTEKLEQEKSTTKNENKKSSLKLQEENNVKTESSVTLKQDLNVSPSLKPKIKVKNKKNNSKRNKYKEKYEKDMALKLKKVAQKFKITDLKKGKINKNDNEVEETLSFNNKNLKQIEMTKSSMKKKKKNKVAAKKLDSSLDSDTMPAKKKKKEVPITIQLKNTCVELKSKETLVLPPVQLIEVQKNEDAKKIKKKKEIPITIQLKTDFNTTVNTCVELTNKETLVLPPVQLIEVQKNEDAKKTKKKKKVSKDVRLIDDSNLDENICQEVDDVIKQLDFENFYKMENSKHEKVKKNKKESKVKKSNMVEKENLQLSCVSETSKLIDKKGFSSKMKNSKSNIDDSLDKNEGMDLENSKTEAKVDKCLNNKEGKSKKNKKQKIDSCDKNNLEINEIVESKNENKNMKKRKLNDLDKNEKSKKRKVNLVVNDDNFESKNEKFNITTLSKILKNDVTKVKTLDPAELLKGKMLTQLNAARFRMINEELYTTTGSHAKKMFSADREAFDIYHQGYQSQISKWPLDPLSIIVSWLKDKPKDWVVADFGCGEGRLATLVTHEVHSLDLVAANENIIACDMACTPLKSSSIQVVVFCLSLMGTNIGDFISEAHRVLRIGGIMKIVEVESRFTDVKQFVANVCKYGFKSTETNQDNSYFWLFEFKKVFDHNKKNLPPIQLDACTYKKR